MTNYQQIVSIPSGYYLEQKEIGFLSVIIPEKRTNYVLNPVLVSDIGSNVNILKNVGASSVSVTRINGGPFWTDYPRFTVVTNSLIAAIVSPTNKKGTMVASVWAKTISNASFKIRIRAKDSNTNADVTFLSNTFIADKDFTQYEFIFTTSTQGINNVIFDILIVSGPSIDIAGMQLEKGEYSTTFIHGFAGEGYNWNGPPYDGTSTRTENVITGGRKINLKDYGFRITSVEGLGIPDNFEINSQAKAIGLGSIFTCHSIDVRDMTFSGVIYSNNLKTLLEQRNKIGNAIFELNKKRCFIWQPYDCDNLMDCVQFLGILESGMTFGYNTHHGEEIELNITCTDIIIQSCQNKCQFLTTTPVSSTAKLIAFNENGSRVIIPNPSLATFTLSRIIKIAYSFYTKKVYAACLFLSGTTQRYVILEYDGEEWIPIIFSTTAINTIYTYGNWLFAGVTGNSSFTTQNGWTGTGTGLIMMANLSRKNIVNGAGLVSTSNVLNASGSTVAPKVNVFESDGGDYIYFGGNFAASPLEAKLGMLNIRSSATAQPSREPHGINDYATLRGEINAILYIREKRELWFAGDFNNNIATGVANVAQTFMGYSFTRATQINRFGNDLYQYLQKIGGTSVPRPFGTVYALAYYRGRVIMGGDFDDSDTSSVLIPSPHRVNGIIYIDDDGLAKPFPSNWGFSLPGAVRPIVYDMTVCDNILHIAGNFRNFGTVNRSTGIVTATGMARGAADFIASGYAENGYMKKALPSVNTDLLNGVVCTDNPDYSLIYYNSSNAASMADIHQPTKIVLCANRLNTRPILYIRGPGTISGIVNFKNNTRIFLDYKFTTFGLVNSALASDEIVMFDFTTNPVKIISSPFGDISDIIQPSSIPIELEPGENDILIDFVSGSTTVHTRAWICWQDTALSAEALQTECL